ncbi:MAG: methyltransferase domain-containing protein [Deltaproteobacteria bacterium]|nr:MAG: methyltransferase domain-containing protein [Deltaproteobacteria bacterium]
MGPLPRKLAYALNLLLVVVPIYGLILAYAHFGWPGLIAGVIVQAIFWGLVMYLSFLLPIGRQRYKKVTTLRPKIYEVLANLFAGHDLEGIRTIIDECRIKPGERILDIASGTGYAAIGIMSLVPDINVVALDLSRNMLLKAREKAEGKSIYLNLGDAEQLPYKDGSFEVVLSIFHLNLTPNRQKAIVEMVRVARSGGRVAIQVPRPFSPYMRRADWYAEKLAELGLIRIKISSNSFLCSLITAQKP